MEHRSSRLRNTKLHMFASDCPKIAVKKNGFADDMALASAKKSDGHAETVLSADMNTFPGYLDK